MASLTVNDIKDNDDAYEFALDQLAYLIKDTLPAREIFRADLSMSVPVDPYITVRPMVVSGFNPSEYGNDPFDRIEDEAGNEYDLFQWKIVCDVKTYKGNAFTDLIKVRHALKHKVKHEEFFGKYKTVGVGAVSTIANSSTPIDNQEMEAGASTRITLHYICKALDDSFGNIETIEGVVKNDEDSTPFSTTYS